MQRRRKSKAFIAVVLALQIVFLTISPVYAWKPKTHVLSANLILEELTANSGYLVFPYFGKIKVPDTYLTAIQTYPDYFRAGSIGPDAFPDIYIGQAFAHPQTKLKSGDWIKYLIDQVNKMPAQSDERKRVLAFTLGYIVHASGDLFGHSYVNRWAEGAWPEISDMENITDEEKRIIVRHNAVEEFIDNKIPEKFYTPEYNSISIPKQFIYDNFITNGKVPNYDNVSSDNVSISPFYAKTGAVPKHLETFFEIREELKNGIATRESYNPVRIYQEYWLEDIDEGLRAWVDTSEKVGRALVLPEEGFSKAKEYLEEWAIHHYLSMVGAPDFVGGAIGAVVDVASIIDEVTPDFVIGWVEEMKRGFYDAVFLWAYDIRYTELEAVFVNPTKFLGDTAYFPKGSEAKLQAEVGFFSSIRNTNSPMMNPFKNSILMAKLNLIGREGMEEILKLAKLEHIGADFYPPICFIKSLDVGYDCNDISFEGLRIWDDHWAREAIFDNIFNAETSKYKWYSKNERDILDAFYTVMPWEASPGPDNMQMYSALMSGGWTKADVENDLRQRLAAQAYLDDYRKKTEILEETINADTVIESLNPGMPRAVYKNLNLNGNKLTVNCNLEIDRMGSVSLNGGTLIVNGDLTIKEAGVITGGISQGGALLVNGGNLIVHGNLILRGGILDAGRGAISTDRDFEQSGGLMNVNGGKVSIAGNYGLSFMQKPLPGATGAYAAKYSYVTGNGVLHMGNDNDHVIVGGSFITTSEASHEKYLTAGTLEVKGDFYQGSWAYGCKINAGVADLFISDALKSKKTDKTNFRASGSHKVLLSGDKAQNVGMAITSASDSQFNILETANSTGVKFVTKVTIAKLFNHNNKPITLSDAESSIFPDYDGDGQKDNIDTTPCPPAQDKIGDPLLPGIGGIDTLRPGIGGKDALRPWTGGPEILRPENRGVDALRPGIGGTDTLTPGINGKDTSAPGVPGVIDRLEPAKPPLVPDGMSSNMGTVTKPPITERNTGLLGKTPITPPAGQDIEDKTPATSSDAVPKNLKAAAANNGVELQWDAINSQTIMGYHIYRGIRSGQLDEEPLNGIPILRTNYIDITVKPGTTYYYSVTVFNWDGSESEHSEEISVTTPMR